MPGTAPRKELRDLRQEQYGELKDMRVENRTQVKTMMDTNKDAPKEDRMENRQEIKDQRTENREEVKEKREEIKKSLKQKREELQNELHQKMQVRFAAMMERLTKLTDRMQSRVDKIKAEGKDTAAVQVSLDAVKILNTALEVKVKATVIAKGGDEATVTANKTKLDSIKADAKVIHDKLKEVLKAIKAL